jgi:hypothetical protein
MITPSEWNVAMNGTPWQLAYRTVENATKLFLDHSPLGENIATNELVECLYPQRFAIGDGQLARNRIFKGLKQLATRGLQDYCTKSTAPNKYGKFGWRWHARDTQGQHTRMVYQTLYEWIGPYLTPDDVDLGRENFLGVLSDRIVDDLEALARSKG